MLKVTGILIEKEDGRNPGYDIMTHPDLEDFIKLMIQI
jgi:hypothetical protein